MTGLAPVDTELFYVQQRGRDEDSMIFLVARRGDKWYTRIMDCMGLSGLVAHSSRPGMAGFKPYVLCKSWDEVAPLVNVFRTAYVRKVLVECGFEEPTNPWERRNDFLEAVRTADGGVAVNAAVRPRLDARWVQKRIIVNASTGANNSTNLYDNTEEFPWRFKPELTRIPAEEAEKAVRSELEAWWDSKVRQCATWGDAR